MRLVSPREAGHLLPGLATSSEQYPVAISMRDRSRSRCELQIYVKCRSAVLVCEKRISERECTAYPLCMQ